jgi:putative salt-induced outer membrane protein YdiY
LTLAAGARSRAPWRGLSGGRDSLDGGGERSMLKEFRQVLIAGLAASASLFSISAWADQVVMKNGDRVTGSIVKQDGKTITIKTDNFGVVTAPWEQVASVQSDKPVNVVLKDGKTLVGALGASDGKVEVATSAAKVDVAPGEVTAMRNADEQKAYERMLHPGLLELWSGSGSLGWAGANGNAKTLTYTTSANAARVTTTDKTSVYFNSIEASALVDGKSASTAQAVRAGIGYDHNFSPRLFVNTFNDYEYDKFQSLDLRVVIGGGFGFHAVKGERASLGLVGGADYTHATFSTPLVRNAAEAYWGDDYSLKFTGPSSLIQSFRMFNDLSDTGSYRMNFDLAISTRLKKRIAWNVALNDRYLSNPVPGRKSNDWTYTTGLGATFGK